MVQGTVLTAPKRSARKPMEVRWKEEAEFFDRVASRTDETSLTIDRLAVVRYSRSNLDQHFNKELRFKLLGSLAGKSILDVGCGDGLNSVMMAMMGARVTGIDISPKTIELARRRAEINGVADRVEFICTPMETARLAENSFDIVWGDAVLHHVIDELDLVMDRLSAFARPDGNIVFAEPVNLFQPLRLLRRLIPVRTDGTPGERPLVRSELDLVKRYIPEPELRYFSLFGRLDRFILVNFNYERSSWLRRKIVSGINRLDRTLLSLPIFQPLAGACVIFGHPIK